MRLKAFFASTPLIGTERKRKTKERDAEDRIHARQEISWHAKQWCSSWCATLVLTTLQKKVLQKGIIDTFADIAMVVVA